MNRLVSILTAATLTAAPLAASPLPELSGPIEPRLVLDTTRTSPLRMKALKPEEAAALPSPLAAGDQAFGGSISFPLPSPLRVVLVEPGKGAPFLYVDRDRDGKLLAEERFALPGADGSGKGAAVSLPLAAGGPFSSQPLEILHIPEAELSMPPAMKGDADRILMVALSTYVEGRVPVDGKPLLVRFAATSSLEKVDPHNGTIEMDVDGDGEIDPRPGSAESDRAKGGPAIFKIGERYVSLKSIDLAAGRMVLESHPASDYKRVDLSIGSTVPDFSFVDLDGKPHKLSDWRGRYVLLDFWATWCVPCIAEFPALKEAYEEYHPRGFDVVGIVFQDEDEKVRKFLAEPARRLPWLQATEESMREMTQQRFRIQSVPATILLDPQGKVVSAGRMGEPPLKGGKLAETLATLLPPPGGAKAGNP